MGALYQISFPNGKSYNLGRKATPETRAALSRAQIGRLDKNNKSGVVGVTWDRQTQKWRAHITINARTVHLGRFTSIDDAATARGEAIDRLHHGGVQ